MRHQRRGSKFPSSIIILITSITLYLLYIGFAPSPPGGTILGLLIVILVTLFNVRLLFSKNDQLVIIQKDSPSWPRIITSTLVSTVLIQVIILAMAGGLLKTGDNIGIAGAIGLLEGKNTLNILLIFAGVTMVPLGEEIIFRGVVLGAIKKSLSHMVPAKTSNIIAVFGSALIYTCLFPFNKTESIVLFLTGVFLGVGYLFAKSLVVPVMARSLLNLWFFFTLLYGPHKAFSSGVITFVFLIVCPLFTFIILSLFNKIFFGRFTKATKS